MKQRQLSTFIASRALWRGAAALTFVTLFTACGASIAPDDDTLVLDGNGGPKVNHVPVGDATVTTVDASAEAEWVFLDLESGQQRTVTDPMSDASWDLAFQRFHIMSNGGASGSGGMQVAIADDVAFDDVLAAPTQGWSSDEVDGDDDDQLNDFAFGDWYAYDPMSHTLEPKARVYVVRSVEGQAYKLQLQGYYSEAGSSGSPSFLWKAVEG